MTTPEIQQKSGVLKNKKVTRLSNKQRGAKSPALSRPQTPELALQPRSRRQLRPTVRGLACLYPRTEDSGLDRDVVSFTGEGPSHST